MMNYTPQQHRMQGIALTIVALCWILLLFGADPEQFGLNSHNPWWTRLTFHFVHGNALHVLLNAFALLSIVFKTRPKDREWIASVIIASSCPFTNEMYVVGLSAIIFAVLGIRTLYCVNKRQVFLSNLSVIVLGIILPHMAWAIHMWSYFLGLLFGLITVPIIKLKR